jgi:hypothetical protein
MLDYPNGRQLHLAEVEFFSLILAGKRVTHRGRDR